MSVTEVSGVFWVPFWDIFDTDFVVNRVPPMREVGGLASCLATGQPRVIR